MNISVITRALVFSNTKIIHMYIIYRSPLLVVTKSTVLPRQAEISVKNL